MNKNGEYSHLKRTMLTVFHVRFVFVLFETLGFCKSVRVVFPDLGIGCYIPYKSFTKWNAYFKNLQWYSAVGWDTTEVLLE